MKPTNAVLVTVKDLITGQTYGMVLPKTLYDKILAEGTPRKDPIDGTHQKDPGKDPKCSHRPTTQ